MKKKIPIKPITLLDMKQLLGLKILLLIPIIVALGILAETLAAMELDG